MIRKVTLFAFILLTLFSCSKKERVEMQLANAAKEIQLKQNLEFELNDDVFPDTLLQKWLRGSFLKIEPAVEGRYKFIRANAFVFSPDKGFHPSTEYTVSLKSLPVVEGVAINFKEQKIHTPLFKVDNLNVSYISNEDGELLVKGEVDFNYDLSPSKLKQYMTIEIDGKKCSYTLEGQSINNKVYFVIKDFEHETNVNVDVVLTIEKAFSCEGAKTALDDDVVFESVLIGKKRFMVSKIYTDYENYKAVIQVVTTQSVRQDDFALKKHLSIDPPVKFNLTKSFNGFKLSGDFESGKTYKVRIRKGLLGALGSKLDEDFIKNVRFGTEEPYLNIVENKAYYLSSAGEKRFAVELINVKEVEVEVFKIFENNIYQYFKNGKRWNYKYVNNTYHESYEYPFDEQLGRPIFKKKVHSSNLDGVGRLKYISLNFDEIAWGDKHKGFYVVRVSDAERSWLQEVKLISLSDIGLISKVGKDNIYVFANSVKDASPIQGVNVDFVSTNNQKIFSAVTDQNGLVVFENYKKKFPEFTTGMVLARLQDDFNFLLFNKTGVETSKYDVGGKFLNALNYDVFVYGDRNLYRPGDSVFVNVLVRNKQWQTVDQMPVKVKFVTPSGKDFRKFNKALNKQGAAEFAVQIPSEAMTGPYSVDVYSGNDILLKSYTFLVEEFMPDRIKVVANVGSDRYEPGMDAQVQVNAMNLYGTPAADRNVEFELQVHRSTPDFSKKYADYSFTLTHKNFQQLSSGFKKATTDDEGNASASFEIDNHHNIGLLEGTIYTTVFDETGRSVARANNFEILTQSKFFGIKDFDYYVNTKKKLSIPLVAVNREGELLNKAIANVKIVHYHWETVLEKYGNGYKYRSQKREDNVFEEEVLISKKETKIDFHPNVSGRYEIRVGIPGSSSYVARSFYAYGWGDTDFSSFEVDREGEVLISFDKEKYNVGDRAKLIFKAPFEGKLLVTVEKDNVEQYYYLDTDKKSAYLELPINEGFLPNVFVSATLFRAMDGSGIPLTVAHGYQGVKVEDQDRKIGLDIVADEKSRSRKTQKVKVKTRPGAALTIAVVDEGVLQVSNYESPDPYDYFYKERGLNVSTYDMYEYLMPELILASSSAAGGVGFSRSRVNPMTNNRVKLLAYWSGQMTADRKGNCEFEFAIPKFSGALRIMAVAYDNNKFGMAEAAMKVVDPLVISTALPRFASPDDQVDMNVSLSNTTGGDSEVLVKVSVNGEAELVGDKEQRALIEAGKEVNLQFPVKMSNEAGHCEVNVEAEFDDEIFEDETKLTIRPAAALIKYGGSGSVKAGNTNTLKTNFDLLESTVSSIVTFSQNPLVKYTDQLQKLVRYPHGCLEQKISKVFPQLKLRTYFMETPLPLVQNNPDFNVQQAVYSIQNQQLHTGAFSYWAGDYTAHPWVSVYATHFLIEAEKAGFDVNRSVIKKAIDYIRFMAKEKRLQKYIYRVNGKDVEKERAAKENLYAQFVLSLYGKPDNSIMNYYKAHQELLTVDSKYLLGAAYALVGDSKAATELTPSHFVSEHPKRSWSGTFSSPLRDRALSFYVTMLSQPDHLVIPELYATLDKRFSSDAWMSTQEQVYFFMALAEMNRSAGEAATGKLIVDGEEVLSSADAGKSYTECVFNKNAQIKAEGEGQVFYYYGMEGISSTNKSKSEDVNLKVRKRFFTRDGSEIKKDTFQQNDLVVVALTVQSTADVNVENVVLTDMLPACFEIENPRIAKTKEYDWMHVSGSYQFMDIRDDRINYYLTATKDVQTYYYMVRVVSRGEYNMGAVSADAMYDNNFRSYFGGGKVIVK